MSKNRVPCYQCKLRRAGCHGDCVAYQQYAAEQEQIRQGRSQAAVMCDYLVHSGAWRKNEQMNEKYRRAGIRRW